MSSVAGIQESVPSLEDSACNCRSPVLSAVMIRRLAAELKANGWQVGAHLLRPANGRHTIPARSERVRRENGQHMVAAPIANCGRTVCQGCGDRTADKGSTGRGGVDSIPSMQSSFFPSSLRSATSTHPCDPTQSSSLGQIVSWHGSERPLGMKTADPISADIAPASACGRSSGDA